MAKNIKFRETPGNFLADHRKLHQYDAQSISNKKPINLPGKIIFTEIFSSKFLLWTKVQIFCRKSGKLLILFGVTDFFQRANHKNKWFCLVEPKIVFFFNFFKTHRPRTWYIKDTPYFNVPIFPIFLIYKHRADFFVLRISTCPRDH